MPKHRVAIFLHYRKYPEFSIFFCWFHASTVCLETKNENYWCIIKMSLPKVCGIFKSSFYKAIERYEQPKIENPYKYVKDFVGGLHHIIINK